MAKRYKQKTQNCKPSSRVNYNEKRFLRYQKDINIIGGGTGTYEGDTYPAVHNVIPRVWNEVGAGSGYSSFPGVDPNGVNLNAITYGRRCEDMHRFDLIAGAPDDWDDADDDGAIDSSLIHEYFYDQGRKEVKKGKKSVPRWEYYCRPEYTYEEEYFQHIFNWPTTHSTKERKIAGVIQDAVTTYSASGGDPPTCEVSGPVYSYYEVNATYPSQSLTLSKVVSKIYYIDDNWDYQEITLNSDGTISGDAVTDKIGEPIIYHGGTDDKTKLFFHYVVEGTAIATDNIIAIGDQINGITVSNVVNYIVDVALKRTVFRHSAKRTEDKEVSQSEFLAANPNHTAQLYTDTKGWIKLNSADGIEIGDIIFGKGVAEGTIVTGVDEARKRIYISNTIRGKKVKLIKIRNDTVNKVNKNTLCYAVLASDANFTADATYSVTRNGASTGITICARAGAGIINRSAIVGIYNSKDKKDVEYEPIFYSSDPNCQKVKIEDSNGEYTLGTRVYGDNSRDEGLYLLNRPDTKLAYEISSMYYAATNGPIDKSNLEKWINRYNSLESNTSSSILSINPILTIYSEINSYAQSTLGGKKVAGAIDDTCGDEIVIEYTQVYNPFVQMGDIQEKVTEMKPAINDICLVDTNPDRPATSIDGIQEKFKEIIRNSVSQSSFLSQDYYNRLVANDDSLFNRITDASNLSLKAIPTSTNINNLPPQIEGQDTSGERFIAKSYRDLPPSTDRVKYYITDLLIGNDDDMNPTLNLDPGTTHNQPKIIISSIPVWTGAAGATYTDTADLTTVTFTVSVTNNSYGGIETIDVTHSGPTPAIVFVPDPPPACPPGSYVQHVYSWLTPRGHRVFKDHKETFDQGGYVVGTNWHVNPDIRDLENKNIPEDDRKTKEEEEKDHLNMNFPVYPRNLWAPNISYQRDYHKMFWFRPTEVTELIGETIENFGNPYLDAPISSKITQTIKPGDTTIHVQSTSGFLSSGYLIIPKYTKKFYTVETSNAEGQFAYSGEEIIYYKSKTDTTFENCERECFGTSSNFVSTISVRTIERGVRYQISSLGTTNWQDIGAPEGASVGTIFVATKDGDGSGTVTIYGTTDKEVPDPTYIGGVEKPPLLPSISSYEKGHSIAQHWIFRIKED